MNRCYTRVATCFFLLAVFLMSSLPGNAGVLDRFLEGYSQQEKIQQKQQEINLKREALEEKQEEAKSKYAPQDNTLPIIFKWISTDDSIHDLDAVEIEIRFLGDKLEKESFNMAYALATAKTALLNAGIPVVDSCDKKPFLHILVTITKLGSDGYSYSIGPALTQEMILDRIPDEHIYIWLLGMVPLLVKKQTVTLQSIFRRE